MKPSIPLLGYTSWLDLKRTAAPTTPILYLSDAKAHLQVPHTEDDHYITLLVDSATAFVEGPFGIGYALITQTWRMTVESDGHGHSLAIPLNPVQDIVSITVEDDDGDITTIDPATYRFDTDLNPCIVKFKAGVPKGKIKITFVAGFGTEPEDVPGDLRAAVMLLVRHWYENRSAAQDYTLNDAPLGVTAILDKYRVIGVA